MINYNFKNQIDFLGANSSLNKNNSKYNFICLLNFNTFAVASKHLICSGLKHKIVIMKCD